MHPSTFLIREFTRSSYQRFVRATKNPAATTETLWKQIWSEIGESSYWKKHRPSSNPGLHEFGLSDYNDYASAIREASCLDHSPLATRKLLCWGQSSGTTTGFPKILPITSSHPKQMNEVYYAFVHSYLKQNPNFIFGKALFFMEWALEQPAHVKTPRAYLSNYGISQMSSFGFNQTSVVPRSLYMSTTDYISDWTPVYALAGDIHYMSMILPSNVHGLWNQIQRNIDLYWPYLEGKVPLPAPLPPLAMTSQRLAHLKHVFGASEPGIDEIWPSLQVLFSWRSGISSYQEAKLRPILGTVPLVNLPYCATEAFIGVSVDRESTDSVLHPGANLVEFLPAHIEAQSTDILKPWELSEGEDYEVLLTTSMGLVRYQLKDVVRCTGFFNRSPIIEFVSKAAHLVRLSTTNVYEVNIAKAAEAANFSLKGKWFFGPNLTGDSLQLYVQRPESAGSEWDTSEESKQIQLQLAQIDSNLKKLNPEYAIERDCLAIVDPSLVSLPVNHSLWKRSSVTSAKPRILISKAPDA